MPLKKMVYQKLKTSGIDFFVSVPCRYLDGLITEIKNDPSVYYTPVAREEEGVGILAGSYLAGKKPAIIMQNSGLGNSINAICSLINHYKIPLVFLISHRGTEGEKIDAQKPVGQVTQSLLETISIPYYEMNEREDIEGMKAKIEHSFSNNQSIAFLFSIKFWSN